MKWHHNKVWMKCRNSCKHRAEWNREMWNKHHDTSYLIRLNRKAYLTSILPLYISGDKNVNQVHHVPKILRHWTLLSHACSLKCCSISGVTSGWWWRWWDSSTYTPQDSKHYTRVHATPLEPNTRIQIPETWELSGTKVKTSVVSFGTTSDEFTCGLNQRPDQLGEQPSCLQGQNNKRCVNLTGWLSSSCQV